VGDRILRALALTVLWTCLVAGVAQAGGRVVGKVTVTDPGGARATPDVIVYMLGFTEPPGDQVATIAQKGRRFVPDLVAVTVGQSISFPNADSFLHNVFSQTTARKFDLGSFKKGESKDKAFPNPGVIDVYCNIHPEMAATILVLPNTRHTRTGRDGSFAIDGVPAGTWTVFAYARRVAKPVSARITVVDGQDAKVDLSLARGAEPPHVNKFGEQYKPSTTVYK
jgi:plastocyanin